MKSLPGIPMTLLVPAFVFTGFVQPATAQDKAKEAKKEAPAAKAEKGKVVTKTVFENDHMRVFEATFKPGDVAPTGPRPLRVIRPLKSGVLERTFADGTTDKVEFKAGEVKVLQAEPKPYTPKNIGKSDLSLYVDYVKEPKK
ncbi:MAG: hypothetical protein FJY54_11180 [Betaproteobacteria bacterium]|nr:hypothetical protein [Betaproteobacteria bacterium]